VGALLGVPKLTTSTFAAYLAIELYSSFFLLLFGGVLAYAAGASIAAQTSRTAPSTWTWRARSVRTRLYLEKWAALAGGDAGHSSPSRCSRLAGHRHLFKGATLDWRWFLLGTWSWPRCSPSSSASGCSSARR